ncbi:nose resistant to fluoxetine protein 6-like [Limulus polyphemus]|uniref:Nose resistant to fluoxetine protein 6-like n=1 Tax=Limulus polyphemus TaxID=6850 RepID=A0ABM1SDN8_LIMPO|nr:nose resistant to fluoxetine protein 6-like [Limulus polyphemus]
MFESKLQVATKSWVSRLRPYIQSIFTDVRVTSQCAEEFRSFLQDLVQMKTWAFEMFDASGKPPGGLLEGTVTAFGSFDQCLRIWVPKRYLGPNNGVMQGQYCSVHFQPPLPSRERYDTALKTFDLFSNISSKDNLLYELGQHAQYFTFIAYRFGICVPSSCTREDVTKVAKKIGEHLDFEAHVIRCETKKPWRLDWVQIFVCMMLLLVCWLVGTGTVIDLALRNRSSVDTFSPMPQRSMIKILLAFSLYTNGQKLLDTSTSSDHLKALHGKIIQAQHPAFYFPQILECLEHTWYIGNDMAFHIISLTVLIPLVRNAAKGMMINCVLILVSVTFSGLITAIRHYPPTMFFPILNRQAELQLANEVYFNPLNHLAPYCVGLTVGYLINKRQGKTLSTCKTQDKSSEHLLYPDFSTVLTEFEQTGHPAVTFLSRFHTKLLFGWILTIMLMLSTIFGIYNHVAGYTKFSTAASSLYAALHRLFWAAGVSWVIFVCSTGNGGLINTFLSWKAFVPLSRLAYMTYLSHLCLLWLYVGNIRERVYAGHLTTMCTFLGCLVFSFVFSFICALGVEAPFRNLEKMIVSSVFQREENNVLKEKKNDPNNFEIVP